MGFDRDYSKLLELAAQLEQYSGYLDSEDKQQFGIAKGAYRTERNRTVYDILSEKPDLDLVYDRIRNDLDSIAGSAQIIL